MTDKFDHLLYESGLTAQGCWDELDSYAKEAILTFGKLVVKECSNQILEWKSEPFPYDPEFGARLIKDHFGVE